MQKNFIKEYLPDESLDKISKEIAEIEKRTSGEIRLCIKKKRGFFQIKLTPRDIALKEFFKLKMHNTKDKTGVLIMILFDERKFEIVADEGIDSKIPVTKWNELSNDLSTNFSNEKYLEGILYGLKMIGEVLMKEFPVRPGDKDELSNEVIIKH